MQETVCHYCSISSFLKMIEHIEQKENKFYLPFWASGIYAMNDPSEFIYGYRVLINDILPAAEKKNGIKDDRLKLSKLWKQIQDINNSADFDDWLLEAIYRNNESPFIISFSKRKDFLPMWNAYADKGKGLCLCFNNYEWSFEHDDITIQHRLHATDVSYGRADESIEKIVNKLYRDLYEKYKDITNKKQRAEEMIRSLASLAVFASPYHKHEAYDYEEEVRLVKHVKNKTDVKSRISNQGRIIPYIEVHVKQEYLSEVIVGPCADSQSVIRSLKFILGKYGIKNIVASKIPYREY